jgi:hypothetical protein
MANQFVIKNGLIVQGGGLQMSGSLGITGSLNVSSVINAGTDTDKFLVLDSNGNVDFRTGTEVLSDIGGIAAGAIKNYASVNNVVDFKTITDGYASLTTVTDIQTSPNSPFAHWIAPSSGYIERVVVMVGETNGTTDDFTITPYKNGAALGSAVTQTQGAARTSTEFSFGSSYSFIKRDRIVFGMDKRNNTSDLYTFNVYFFTEQ